MSRYCYTYMYRGREKFLTKKRSIQTEEGMKLDRKKTTAEAKKRAAREESKLGRQDMTPEGTWIPDWLTGFYPGTKESIIAYALVRGFEDKDELAESLGVSRKKIARVEKKLRSLGYVREEIVRYRPPNDRLDFFKHERLASNPPQGDLPF